LPVSIFKFLKIHFSSDEDQREIRDALWEEIEDL